MSQAVTHFQGEFARLAGSLPGAGHPVLDGLRAAALARFVREGLPGIRQEDWKYTSLASLERRPLPVAAADAPEMPTLSAVVAQAVLPDAVHRLVFVDGHFAPSLSRHTLPAGVRAGSLANRLADQPDGSLPFAVDRLLAASAAPAPTGVPAAGSSLAVLNLALGADGFDLHIPAGVVIDAPILVLFVSASAETTSLPTSHIRLDAGARATVIEQHFTLHEGASLTSVVERITLAPAADLHHIKVQHANSKAQHVADTEATIAANAQLHSLVLALGGQLAREDLRITLAESGAHADLDGLYLARGRMHLDHHTTVHHASPTCTSAQDYRGILDEAGRGVFNGRVIVAKDAQHTDAQQHNANLLLSENAEIDTKPQLEIFADDVKCSHGATIGQLDPAELFYLRSRGLDETAARSLVTFAFAARALHRIDSLSPLFAALRTLLFARLPGGSALEDLTR